MPRHATIATHLEKLLGTGVISTTPVAGGDICLATRARLSDGRSVFVKSRPGAPPDFFNVEARGLRWLADGDPAGGITPTVLGADEDCLALEWIEPGRPSSEAAEQFGRALARTHRSGANAFGDDRAGYAGTLRQPNDPAPTWAEFYATRRIEPHLRKARNRGTLTDTDGAAVEQVLSRIEELAGPPEPPARLHGDLWSGNLVWGVDGRVHLVDPAAFGGHREFDLAMLTLFGAPHLNEILQAYQEEFPLADGWRERAGLHQLSPLLVHTILFGGGYGARTGQTARELLATLR